MEFKDSLMMTRPVGYSGGTHPGMGGGGGGGAHCRGGSRRGGEGPSLPPPRHHPFGRGGGGNCHGMANLVHVQLGQVVKNSAVEAILLNARMLEHLHCYTCPDLSDRELGIYSLKVTAPYIIFPQIFLFCHLHFQSSCSRLRCFYIYEAPLLTFDSFQTLLDSFPELKRFGNLTRWAVNCEGIQQVVRSVRQNNLDVEILCGSHWFNSR